MNQSSLCASWGVQTSSGGVGKRARVRALVHAVRPCSMIDQNVGWPRRLGCVRADLLMTQVMIRKKADVSSKFLSNFSVVSVSQFYDKLSAVPIDMSYELILLFCKENFFLINFSIHE